MNKLIIESVGDVDKLKHLEHAEDHVINHGSEGYHHAVNTLMDVHHHLDKKATDTKITTKYDGSPSVVFGYHPQTKKFFVATKSAFNKNPKINYTHADIEANHGHAPGLVSKLKHALKHLPKIAPKHGVYQGDIMHTHDDREEDDHSHHFKPNTIRYSVKKNSEHGKKVGKSKIGIAIHTKYHGDTIEGMKADFSVDHKAFAKHDDVHHIEPKAADVHYTPEQRAGFEHHMHMADAHHHETDDNYKHLKDHGHSDHLKTYINSTIDKQTKPTVKGYADWHRDRASKAASKVKTVSKQMEHIRAGDDVVAHINKHKGRFANTLALHHHLQQAKNHLVHALSSDAEFDHSVDGKKVKPEGFVATRNGRPTKLVDRHEFSYHNFQRNR